MKGQPVMKCPFCIFGTVYRCGNRLECDRCGAFGPTIDTMKKPIQKRRQ